MEEIEVKFFHKTHLFHKEAGFIKIIYNNLNLFHACIRGAAIVARSTYPLLESEGDTITFITQSNPGSLFI